MANYIKELYFAILKDAVQLYHTTVAYTSISKLPAIFVSARKYTVIGAIPRGLYPINYSKGTIKLILWRVQSFSFPEKK